MAYARPAPDRPRGAAVKAYWLEPRKRRRGDREPGLGLTPYSVEQADPDRRPRRGVVSSTAQAWGGLRPPSFGRNGTFRAPSVKGRRSPGRVRCRR